VRPAGRGRQACPRPVTEERAGEGPGLRAWAGQGSVLLLEEDPDIGALLLERLDATRPLSGVPDDLEALRVLTGYSRGGAGGGPRGGTVVADLRRSGR
jgi:Aminoglycoside/hydroxyurea antibiotic resistance kinase